MGNSPEGIEVDVKRLIRGLMSKSDKIALPAYKRLFEAGTLATPVLVRELERVDPTKALMREAMTMVVGLMALLHDLDEQASKKHIERFLSAKCYPALASALKSIARHTSSQYRRSMFGDVAIFEEAVLDVRHNATAQVKEWLSDVPPKDLQGLSRLYIVATKPTFDFYGSYLPTLRVITLVWETRFDDVVGPGSLVSRTLAHHRQTLFHEIGHHFHDHREFGQDPQQEAEANAYASKLMRRVAPIATRLTSAIAAMIRSIMSLR